MIYDNSSGKWGLSMIKNQWYAVLESKELKKNRLVGVTRLSQKLVLWRDGNGIGCIFDRCCHRGASLGKGKLVDSHVECPFHGFRYDAIGRVTLIPANGKDAKVPERFRVDSYQAREAYGFIWVWYGDLKDGLSEIPFFEELKSGYVSGGFSEVWDVHYTRAIENQLDVVHLPFVHRTTIGKGHKTLVNGPVVKWDGNLMTFYVKNEQDHGQIPQRPGEVEDYSKLFYLQLLMPNVWQNVISDRFRIVAVFAPVDETSTRIYIHIYQNFLTVPVLSRAVSFIGSLANRVVLHQDRRVVLTQVPIKSELKIDENLIQGDLPIIEYRKKRESLKKGTNSNRGDDAGD